MKKFMPHIAIIVAAGMTLSAGAAETTNPHDVSLEAVRTVGSVTTGMKFNAIGFTSEAGAETSVYLTQDGTQSGAQLDLTSANLYFDGTGTTVIAGGNVKSDTTVANGVSTSGYAFVVAEGSVVLDNAQLGNIKQNLSVGTAYTNGGSATLTLKNGAVLETTNYYNSVGANGTAGTINVSGTGTTLKTQQITLGAGTSGMTSYASTGLAKSDTEFYWTPAALYDDNVSVAEGTGTINVSDGAKMYVGDGNPSGSTNKLQIFNGSVNVDGENSELVLGDKSKLTMDPNYGTLAQASEFSNAINVTNGGKVSVGSDSDGNAGALAYFSMGLLYGDGYNVSSALNVGGSGSEVAIETASVFIGGVAMSLTSTENASTQTTISVSDGANLAVSATTGSVDVGYTDSAYSDLENRVTFEISGEDTSFTLESAEKYVALGTSGRENTSVTFNVSDGASAEISAGTTIYADSGTEISVSGDGSALSTAGSLLLDDGSVLSIGSGSAWSSDGDVTVKDGATLAIDVSSANPASVTFTEGATLSLADGAVVKLTLGDEELESLKNDAGLGLAGIFSGATLSVSENAVFEIFDSSGTSVGTAKVGTSDNGGTTLFIPEPSAFVYPSNKWLIEAGTFSVKPWYTIQNIAYEKGVIKDGLIGNSKVMFFDIWDVVGLYEQELKNNPYKLYGLERQI